MGNLIVIEFVTLDGVVDDPDGSGGTLGGGGRRVRARVAARHRRHAARPRGLELFAKLWPGRTDEFSTKMNTIPKLVVSFPELVVATAGQRAAITEPE